MKPKPLPFLFGMFCGLWTVAVADAPDAREKLHIRTTPAGYDSIVASWKANAVSETFDNYARDFIGLDTSRFLPALSTVTETVCRQRLRSIFRTTKSSANRSLPTRRPTRRLRGAC